MLVPLTCPDIAFDSAATSNPPGWDEMAVMKGVAKWLAGIAATVIAGVILWLITKEGPSPPPPPDEVHSVEYYLASTNTCGEKERIKWWDLDANECTSSTAANSHSDFWFKHTNLGPNETFCVDAKNGAKFAPYERGSDPWQVSSGQFARTCDQPDKDRQ